MPATRTLTFLFTDLEGSTRLWERYPAAMPAALSRHDAILREAIETHGGTVVKTTGDGMMAVFGGAIDATSASLAAQRALIAEPWGEAGPLRVRMGVHCGEAEQRGGDFFGTTVNRTARIMAAGHGGQVLLSASAGALAVEQLPDGCGLLDLGEHHLRDLGRPEHLFQLVHPDLPSRFPPLVTARSAGTDLPSRVAALIGRRDEIAQITDRLAEGSVRLLTLTGPGGTGKTTLAIRVARDLASGFRDGVSFVDLSAARDTNAALVAIARGVGLGEILDRDLADELTDHLRDRRMLIVLDNLEQVTEAAGVVAGLLSDCPGLTVLATSREALHVRAEQVFAVPPLSLPPPGRGQETAHAIGDAEAVQLFVDRARVVRPEFELTDDNAPAVAEICRRLDGLPLAIELAAARLGLFSPDVLRDRLDDRLGLLRSGPRDLPERQQTLRSTIDWSYELLEPGEQRLFELLAVFADAEVGAIEAVAARRRGGRRRGRRRPRRAVRARREEPPAAGGRAGWRAAGRDAPDDPRVRRRSARPATGRRVADPPGARRRTTRTWRTGCARISAGPGVRPPCAGWTRTSRTSGSRGPSGSRRADLERLDALAKALLILDDAHGWYLDTVGLASDMLAVVDAVPASPERINQEIALRITLARALMATKGSTPEAEAAFAQRARAVRARRRRRAAVLRAAGPRQPVPVPRAARQVCADRPADPRPW